MSQSAGDLGARRSPESCFNLFQSFALCLWDESHGEDNVEDAHKSKQPEGSSTGQNILKDISVQDIKLFFLMTYGKHSFGLTKPEALTIISWKVLVTKNAMPQLVSTHTALANPLALTGKISDMTSQGIGPQPRAKPAHTNQFCIIQTCCIKVYIQA